MTSYTHTIRVRYRDTDQMGVVYHSVYLEFFETARTELLRAAGIPYSEIESKGLMLPLLNYNVEINRPARYDNLLRVTAHFRQMEGVRLPIEYEIHIDEEEGPLVTGGTTHVFVSSETMSPRRPPRFYLELFGD